MGNHTTGEIESCYLLTSLKYGICVFILYFTICLIIKILFKPNTNNLLL